jgi:predicted HicB family RNase H-like nuclease
MENEYGYDSETFDRVCDNALNGIDPETLTDEEVEIHRQWVADNWADLNAGIEEEWMDALKEKRVRMQDIPASLHQQIRIAAAVRGITIQKWVIEALTAQLERGREEAQ